MKKLILLFAALLIAGCCGCAKVTEAVPRTSATPVPQTGIPEKTMQAPVATPAPAKDANPGDTADKADATLAPTPAPISDPTPEAKEGWTLTICEGQISVTLPESWKECCTVDKGPDYIGFYSRLNRASGMGGYLCGIHWMDVSREEVEEYPSFDILAETSEGFIVVLYPTDVQFDWENEEKSAEYQNMNGDIDAVLASVTWSFD